MADLRPASTAGTVIVLNGTSSSGKTSIARALRVMRDTPYFYVAVDHFNAMRPGWSVGTDRIPEGVAMNSAMHHAVAVLAHGGWDVILDHVLVNPVYRRECAELLADLPALFVGVRCRVEVAEDRERERGDRHVGIARDQFERVHAHGIYDLEVDTALMSPEECALQIKRRIREVRPPEAFRRLRDSPTS